MSKTILRIILFLVLILAFVGLGFYAYQLGLSQGAAHTAAVTSGTAPAPAPVTPYYGPWYWPPFYGFGFLGCLIPFLLFFIFFIALRGLFWNGRPGWRRWHYGWGYPPNGEGTNEGVPPRVAEWHRKLHEEANAQKSDQPGPEKV